MCRGLMSSVLDTAGLVRGEDSNAAHKLLKLHHFHVRAFAAKTHPCTHQKMPPGSIP